MTQRKRNWRRKIIVFLISQCITLFGSQVVQMAIIWYVTLHTASGFWVAAFSIGSYLPQFLISFFGGICADRYHRKACIICADAGIALVTFCMMILMPFFVSEISLIWALLFMAVLRSVGAGIQSPSVNAVILQLVPKEHLMRYNGINAAMQSAVQFSAPAAAGAVLTAGTLRSTLMIDVFTAILGIGLFSFVMLPKKEGGNTATSVSVNMKLGIHYVLSHKIIGKLLAVYGGFTFLCVPGGYLSGLLVSRVYGNTYWHLTAAELCGFGGMAAGGILMSIWGGFKSRRKTLKIGLFLFGAMAIGMGLSHRFIFYLIFMMWYGIALSLVQTTITTLLQENVKISMQGRVFGFAGSLYCVCYPVGMVIFGLMADKIPLQSIIVGSGIFLILITILKD